MPTPEEVKQYCPELWQQYLYRLKRVNDLKCESLNHIVEEAEKYIYFVEALAQARKERDVLKQALEQYADTKNWQPWPHNKHSMECAIDWTIAEQALASINKDSVQ